MIRDALEIIAGTIALAMLFVLAVLAIWPVWISLAAIVFLLRSCS